MVPIYNQNIILLFPGFLGICLGIVCDWLVTKVPMTRGIIIRGCVHCERKFQISAQQIWPLRCNTCGSFRPLRLWIIVGILTISSIFFWNISKCELYFVCALTLMVFFTVVSVIDIEHRVILKIEIFIGLILAFLIGIFRNGILSCLFGAGVGVSLFLGSYLLGKIYVRIRYSSEMQNREIEPAIGFGDMCFGFIISLLLGWSEILIGLFLSVLFTGIFGSFILARRIVNREDTKNLYLPLTPFISLATILVLTMDLLRY